jgi:hypothetical protein
MLLIDRWDNEFDNMNNGREGGGTSYKYPNSSCSNPKSHVLTKKHQAIFLSAITSIVVHLFLR